MRSERRSALTPTYLVFTSLLALTACLAWKWATPLQAQSAAVANVASVSAASYQKIVAPEQIVAGFTANLPITRSEAQDFDPSAPGIQLPTLLGGMGLEVNGRSAGLFFTSPNQINFQVPPDLEPGTGYVTVRSDKGVIIGAGEIEIRPTAPAIFTANANGQGVPAGVLVRLKTNGVQSFEPLARRDPNTGHFVPLPIDLGPVGERVFLVLFLTGARRVAKAADTRFLMGGREFVPDFLGRVPELVGVEQLNFELPRALNGELSFALAALGFSASNICQIEIAPPSGTPPRVAGLSAATVLAGERLEVFGSGLPASLTEEGNEVLIADANNRRFNARLEEASPTRLRILVPFGAGSGNLIVRTPRGESSYPMAMRTSISGIIQTAQVQTNGQTERAGLPNVTVRAFTANGVIERTTNNDGAFLLPDVPPSARTELELDGTTTGLPYPKPRTSLRVVGGRDNQFEGYLELKSATGTPVSATLAGALPEAAFSAAATATPDKQALAGQTGQVVFEPNGSTAQFPDGTRVNELRVTVLDPGRTPADLPAGQYSSVIAQITPFGARLTPGGKLTFPNADGLAAGSTATLFRYDQTPGSATLGQFVAAGAANVSADGLRVETARDAIKETTYYFVSIPRPLTTVYGSVFEEDGTAARGALVQVRGHSIFALTDQNGAFTLPNVPLVGTQDLTLEVSYLRPDGTVDRTERTGVRPTLGALTFVSPPLVLPGRGRTRAPVILAPKTLAIVAGQNSEFPFLAYARVAGQTLRNLTVSDAPFASVISQGNDRYALRLTPAANVSGKFTLTLTATDSQSLRTDEAVVVEVRASNNTEPVADSQSVSTDEDLPVRIVLSGSGGNVYRLLGQPQHGSLSGTPPTLTYTPARDFNGADSFNFSLSNGPLESRPATVSIAVRAINKAPRLDVAARYEVNIGQPLSFVLNGSDSDAGQTLTLSAAALPSGARLVQTTATSWVFSWTPAFDQLGAFTLNLVLRDDAAPPLSDSRSVVLAVDAKWAQTSQLDNIQGAQAFARLGNVVFAALQNGKNYRSADNGVSWFEIGPELSTVYAWAVKGNVLFAAAETGFYRSADQGLNWVKQSNSRASNVVVKGEFLIAVVGAFFTDQGGRLARSTDEGRTWISVGAGLFNNVLSLLVKEDALFVGTYLGGVYRSLDDGSSFTSTKDGLGDRIVNALASNGASLYAGTFGGGVFVSGNNGALWTQVSDGLSDRTVNSLLVNGPLLLVGVDSGLFRSPNGGARWERSELGVSVFQVKALLGKDGVVFAGARGGGILRSANDGLSWQRANNGLGNLPIQTLAVEGSALLVGASSGGAFRSTDNGASWISLNNGLPPNIPIAAFAAKGGFLFAGTNGQGIFRSADNGRSWQAQNEGLEQLRVNALLVKGELLFAGTEFGGVYRSADNGTSWQESSEGMGRQAVQCLLVKDGVLFAGVTLDGLYRSNDNGATWANVTPGLGTQTVRTLVTKGNLFFAGTDQGVFRALTPGGERWFAVNNGLGDRGFRGVPTLVVKGNALFAGLPVSGVYRSDDDGANWTAFNSGLTSRAIGALAVKDELLFAGLSGFSVGGGVAVLAEAQASWSEGNAGLTNRFTTAALALADGWLVGTASGGVFRATNPRQSWSPANTGLPPAADVRTFTSINNGTLAGLAGEGVYFSNDQGRNWTARNAGLMNRFVNALAGNGATVYAGTQGGVYRSFDGGVNWSAASSGLTRLSVLSLVVNGNTVYAGTDNGLFRSTNQGGSWMEVSTGLTDRYIVALGLAPDGTSLLAATSSGLFRSSIAGGNQGQSWTPVTQGLPERVVALTFAQQGRRLLTGTVNGFFVSEDNGVSWRQINGGLLTLQVGALAVSGDTVLAGTRSGGVFVSQLPQ